ncbi:MAG: NADH-quinone oxidoreductase subunit N [Aquificaceae bacterium]
MQEFITIEIPDLLLLMPELIVLFTGFLIFTLDLAFRRVSHIVGISLSSAGYIASIMALLLIYGKRGETLYGLYVRDGLSTTFQLLLVFLTLALLVFFYPYFKKRLSLYPEFYYILNFSLVGAMFLVSSYNLIVLYVALEAVSIGFYILTALLRGDFQSKEGALKYLILGGLSIALASYGAGFMYLHSGSLDLRNVFLYGQSDALILGLVFLMVGFAIKLGAVPFHFWLPDAYQGAPTPITAFMASVGKVAFFVPILRMMPLIQGEILREWTLAIATVSAITMIYANLVALNQTDIKRLLAYSSIANTGYVLAGISTASKTGLKAAGFFLIAYAITSFVSFIVVALLERFNDFKTEIEAFLGLRNISPAYASVLAISIISLLGVPPTVGFVAKALIFLSLAESKLWLLATVMIVATGISAGYYLKLLSKMFMFEPKSSMNVKPSAFERLTLSIFGLLLVLLGILPIFLFEPVSKSVEAILSR